MQQISEKRPLITSIIVCLTLVGTFLIVWQQFNIPTAYFRVIILFTALFCIALITVVVYQSLLISESAHSLATNMTKDMLAYSHELFSEIYRSSPVPYLVIDKNGVIESTNLSAVRLFNVEMEALDGQSAFSFLDSESSDKVALIPEYFKQSMPVNGVEVLIHRPDGMSRWVILSLFSFIDGKSARKGLLTLVDITKQKQVDKAKSEFVSLASHQLRTPISGLKWNIELLQTAGKDRFNELESSYIHKIGNAVERMDMLVGDFLNVSRFELGTLTPTYVAVDLVSFFESVYEEHFPVAEHKTVQIEREWDQNMGSIQSDSHLLHMITSNLLSNAIKYTPAGGKVRIQALKNEGQVVLTVRDTGMGIPIDEQEMIFSKLFRAGNAKANVTDGNGLGLYIVKEAVQVLGGTITFESRENVGTTFTVTLPI